MISQTFFIKMKIRIYVRPCPPCEIFNHKNLPGRPRDFCFVFLTLRIYLLHFSSQRKTSTWGLLCVGFVHSSNPMRQESTTLKFISIFISWQSNGIMEMILLCTIVHSLATNGCTCLKLLMDMTWFTVGLIF